MYLGVEVLMSPLKKKTTKTPHQSNVLCCVLLLQYVKELLTSIQLPSIGNSAKTPTPEASGNVVVNQLIG